MYREDSMFFDVQMYKCKRNSSKIEVDAILSRFFTETGRFPDKRANFHVKVNV